MNPRSNKVFISYQDRIIIIMAYDNSNCFPNLRTEYWWILLKKNLRFIFLIICGGGNYGWVCACVRVCAMPWGLQGEPEPLALELHTALGCLARVLWSCNSDTQSEPWHHLSGHSKLLQAVKDLILLKLQKVFKSMENYSDLSKM